MAINPQKQSAGIKISQVGYNVDTAPDYALAFNSSWPSLPIVKEFSTTVTATGGGGFWSFPQQTFTHNLGIYALAFVWETNGPNIVGSIKTQRMGVNLRLGKNDVVWSGYGLMSTLPGPITLHVKVYNIDISKPVSYDYIQPPVSQSPYDPNFGIKVVKENKSIESKDLRDFIIHSRAQSPAILTIVTESSVDSSGNVTYSNPQGYTNWVYGYVNIGGYYIFAPAQGQAYPVYQFVNGNTYKLSVNGGGGNIYPVSLVVLRDPLFVPNRVEVTY